MRIFSISPPHIYGGFWRFGNFKKCMRKNWGGAWLEFKKKVCLTLTYNTYFFRLPKGGGCNTVKKTTKKRFFAIFTPFKVGLRLTKVGYPISKVVFFRQMNFSIFFLLRVDNEKELRKYKE